MPLRSIVERPASAFRTDVRRANRIRIGERTGRWGDRPCFLENPPLPTEPSGDDERLKRDRAAVTAPDMHQAERGGPVVDPQAVVFDPRPSDCPRARPLFSRLRGIPRQAVEGDIAQASAFAVLAGKDRRRDRPGDGEVGVVPGDRQLVGRSIRDVHFVRHHGRSRRDDESVRKALGKIELPMIVGTQIEADPLAERGGATRTSTATSKIAPASTETSFACAEGACRCRPRSTQGAECERLSCTKASGIPASA